MKNKNYNRGLLLALLLSIITHSGCAASRSENYVNTDPADTVSTLSKYEPRENREKPVIAVVGENTFTETTDFIIPYGILTEADIAEVYALSTNEGPIQMFPALKIQTEFTTSDFDSLYSKGADYVVMPAVHDNDNPKLISWITGQAKKGATIIGVCDGVWTLAHAGLLEERKAVGHWFSFKKLQKKFPNTEWVSNRRYLEDENVVTTTGVSASIPVSLALVEAIAGFDKAIEVAQSLGVAEWSSSHNSSEFSLNGRNIFTAAGNWLAFWSHEDIGVPVYDGIDEISLSLLADSYSRTYKSKALSVSNSDEEIISKRGLVIIPDETTDKAKVDRMLKPFDNSLPVQVLDTTLLNIEEHYGRRTAEFVALQLEYGF